VQTDADGFTVIASGSSKGGPVSAAGPRASQPAPPPLTPGVKSFDSAPAGSPKDGPAPLDDDILERRIKSMRTDFMGDGGNVDELLLSWTEISGTPDAGQKLVQQTVDRMMECKENERLAGIKVIATLAEKGKLTTKDVEDGMNDCIEFIDSMVCDSPRAFEYLGDVLAPLLRIGTIDVPWLCDSCEKTKVSDPDTVAPEKIIHATLTALKKTTGPDAAVAKSKFTANETALKKLLGASTWKTISEELL
jgi:translation initiation factor 4G